MSLTDWLIRESLRRRLSVLGFTLSDLHSDYFPIKSVSSKTVSQRLDKAASDYWRAIDAFSDGHLEDAKLAMSASFLQVEFIRGLMNAETTERELGEGDLFELSACHDENQAPHRIQSHLNQIMVELSNLRNAVRSPTRDPG